MDNFDRDLELIAGVKALLTSVRETFDLHVTCAERYRDDPQYKAACNAALSKGVIEGTIKPAYYTWHLELESPPALMLDQFINSDELRDMRERLVSPAHRGKATEALLAAIDSALNLLGWDLLDFSMNDINAYLQALTGNASPTELTVIRHDGRSYNRLVWSKTDVRKIRRKFSEREDTVIRYCDQAIKFIGLASLVVIDNRAFAVRYGTRKASLGNTASFKLMQYLDDNKGEYLSSQEIRAAIKCDSHAKVVVSRLRKSLRESGLTDLAAAIKTQRGHYGLFLPSATQMQPK